MLTDQAAGGIASNGNYCSDTAGPAKYADILEAHSTIPGRSDLTASR